MEQDISSQFISTNLLGNYRNQYWQKTLLNFDISIADSQCK